MIIARSPLRITLGGGGTDLPGYVEKYGPDERYNFVKFLAAAPCPTLVLFGSVETAKNMAFQESPAEVARLAQRQPRISVETVEGADHFYSGVRDQAWQALQRWLESP